MCEIISKQSKSDYALTTKTLRLRGHVTSVRLENHFWDILYAIAVREGMPINELLNKLNDEVAELNGEPPSNFSSLLRVGCLKFSRAHPDIV